MARITNFLPRLYLPLLLLLVAAYAWRPLEGGFDFWAHAAVGRWIASHGRVPRESLFLWPYPHYPWIAHSWLSQLFFYQLLEKGGPLAVVIFNTVLPLAVFFLLWRVWKREAHLNFLVPLIFALAIWVSAPRFQPRQELISALLLTVVLAFLVAWSQGRFDDWLQQHDSVSLSLIAAPLVTLFFLWVNLHALVATGLIALWITALGELLQTQFSRQGAERQARPRVRALLAISVLCTLATLLNPYGFDYWKAANQLRPSSIAHSIEEWRPFWQPPTMLTLSGFMYPVVEAVLFGAGFLIWLANPQRRWAHLGWLLLGAAFFLHSRRMLWIAAILFLIVMAASASTLDSSTLWRSWRRTVKGNMLEPIPDGLRLLGRAGIVIVLLLWLLMAASRHTPATAGAWKTTMRNVPEGAAQKILDGHLPRPLHIFNDYEDSSYLQWRLNGFVPGTQEVPASGRFPLFTDLLNAYPDRLMNEYFAILDASPTGLESLKQRKINCVVLGDHHWDSGLAKYLDEKKRKRYWKFLFEDKQSKIWVRIR